jgi:hypothetical protein
MAGESDLNKRKAWSTMLAQVSFGGRSVGAESNRGARVGSLGEIWGAIACRVRRIRHSDLRARVMYREGARSALDPSSTVGGHTWA